MKVLSNREWGTLEEYVLSLKKHVRKAEEKSEKLEKENKELQEKVAFLEKNQLSTKTDLLKQIHSEHVKNVTMKAVLEECISLLNSVEKKEERVSVRNLIDIQV